MDPKMGKRKMKIIQSNCVIEFGNRDFEISTNAHIHRIAVRIIRTIIKIDIISAF